MRTWCVLLMLTAGACGEQAATTRAPTSGQITGGFVGKVHLNPGGQAARATPRNPLEGDPTAVSEGERYYNWYNCSGCHGSKGGGGMGPPLRDHKWIYGNDAVSIFESIMEGRPNGMPTWSGTIPDEHAWRIVAFIQSWHAHQKQGTDAQVVQESSQQEGLQ